MALVSELVDSAAQMTSTRRDIHAHPELAFEETRTAELVASRLESWGIEVHRGIARTGVVGVMRRGTSKRSIGLRADMDALPMVEANQFAHRSINAGRMHACGHDGHTAMLLGAARHLVDRGSFDGTVNLIFQPAEEGGNAGARAMIEAGLFERFPCDAVFGMHNWPGMAEGHFGVRDGVQLASSSDFRIRVTGKGTHAAFPHLGADPLLAAAQTIVGLQSIIARNVKASETAVLSITQVQGGTATNIVPDSVWFGGTVRTFEAAVLDLVERRMRAIAEATAAGYECEAHLEFERVLPAVVNGVDETAFVVAVLQELVGPDRVDSAVEPSMGGEDFAFMLQARPGCFVFLGNGAGQHRAVGHGLGPCALHNGSYDFNDALLPIGASYWVRLAERWLAGAAA